MNEILETLISLGAKNINIKTSSFSGNNNSATGVWLIVFCHMKDQNKLKLQNEINRITDSPFYSDDENQVEEIPGLYHD